MLPLIITYYAAANTCLITTLLPLIIIIILTTMLLLLLMAVVTNKLLIIIKIIIIMNLFHKFKSATLIIIAEKIVLLSSKTPLVGEKWDYQGQQVFKSLLHSLQYGDHVQSRSKSCSKKWLVLQTIELKALECLGLKSWLALTWSRVFNKPGK